MKNSKYQIKQYLFVKKGESKQGWIEFADEQSRKPLHEDKTGVWSRKIMVRWRKPKE